MKNLKDSVVECVTAAGDPIEGRLVRLGRFDAVFEMSNCFEQLRSSQVITSLKIEVEKRLLYEGRATIRHLIEGASVLICEVTLDEQGLNPELLSDLEREGFQNFQREWRAVQCLAPEFKLVVADVSILLGSARSWLNQVAVAMQAAGPKGAAERERDFLGRMIPRVIAAFNMQHERFEELAYRISPEQRGAHQSHTWREWSPFFLSTPFGHRTYFKPLGFAGDYEMMDMIHRHAPEGGSLFLKAMHALLMSQWPAESVRNRIAHLGEVLVNETARAARAGRRARILNLGCGPAREVQDFMRAGTLSDHADFVLLDFNEETTQATGARLNEMKRRLGRRTGIEMRQLSVHQLLRSALTAGRGGAATENYDLTYCAGLFDYLTDTTCQALVRVFHHWLAPEGLMVVANMHDAKPFRNFIEFVLDWHLIYRDTRAMWSLCPADSRERAVVIADPTTVNLFLQVRKPA